MYSGTSLVILKYVVIPEDLRYLILSGIFPQLESSLSAASSNGADDIKSIENTNVFESRNISKESHSVLSANSMVYSITSLQSSTALHPSNQHPVNPPLTATEARIQTVELLSQISENVQEVIAAMSDLHTYWEHR